MTTSARRLRKPGAAKSVPAPVQAEALDQDGWRMAGASVRGPYHVTHGMERQDSFLMRVPSGVAVAVVCDGAGSAKRAADGAARFSASVMAAVAGDISAAGAAGLDIERFQSLVVKGVEGGRKAIRKARLSLYDHHATLLALAACADATFIAHVGDGLAAVAPLADWDNASVSPLENGAYANETFFVTEDGWSNQLRCSRHAPLGHGGVAVLMTDGAMPFVIGKGQDALEPAFMEPVSRYLFENAGDRAAQALAGTLDSPDACRISADDKTLVWIGRLPP